MMDFKSIEKKALSLCAEERAKLVQGLLASLDVLSPDEHDKLWLDEAERRAAEIDSGSVELADSTAVSKEARALLE